MSTLVAPIGVFGLAPASMSWVGWDWDWRLRRWRRIMWTAATIIVKLATRGGAIVRKSFTFGGREDGEGICTAVDETEGVVTA
jgi:hypothetical protein